MICRVVRIFSLISCLTPAEAIKNALDLFEKDTGISYKRGENVKGKTETVSGGLVVEKGLVSYAGKFDSYANPPVVEWNSALAEQVRKALALPVDKPYGLRHEAHPPGHDAVMGLAAYPRNMETFRLLVGSLRHSGYDGHIILGVHKDIPPDEEEYLKQMDVTYYTVEFIDCDKSIMDAGQGGGNIRGKCSTGLEKLKLEWGRFEMCRQWLHACKECTGWTMVMDTRDIFFQGHPFASLPEASTAKEDLLFIEEIAPHSNPQPASPHRADIVGESRYVGRTEPCYGRKHFRPFHNRPVLCSGTVIGTRTGIHRFLSVLVDEFYQNNAKPNTRCRSPHTTDQWTMDYLYYMGRFGEYNRTKTLPWGTGPVNTIGTPCVDRSIKDQKLRHSRNDLVLFDNETNLILNIHEPADSKARISPAVHQYDRCHLWVSRWLHQHPELKQKFSPNGGFIPIKDLTLPWKQTQ